MADTLSYTTEKALKDAGDKITPEEKKPVEDAIAELNKVKNGDDLADIKAKTEVLSQAAQKIGETLYKAAAEAQKKDEPPKEGDKPKEAETEEKKDDPKPEDPKSSSKDDGAGKK
ncbi:MAG: hypothetical protein A2Z52_00520 [Candidatus Moranbacteria bacterium RBG_19FT_COMBO_42_6]|nr:MAG: hypothetical protein A2Z52_00520 [Candidatus Moranbacteria bacterium RBG_19FT_COMBO_42_6]